MAASVPPLRTLLCDYTMASLGKAKEDARQCAQDKQDVEAARVAALQAGLRAQFASDDEFEAAKTAWATLLQFKPTGTLAARASTAPRVMHPMTPCVCIPWSQGSLTRL